MKLNYIFITMISLAIPATMHCPQGSKNQHNYKGLQGVSALNAEKQRLAKEDALQANKAYASKDNNRQQPTQERVIPGSAAYSQLKNYKQSKNN